jgi:MerR family transcriptional regulator, light-induced transcriptional regulator
VFVQGRPYDQRVYTVKHAAALTGIPAETLRMWERRYGVVAPARSEGGYRLYDDAAIARLTAMHALVEAGWSPRRAADQVASGTTLGRVATMAVPEDVRDDSDLDVLVGLAGDMDPRAMARALDEVFAAADPGTFLDDWLMPALQRLGLAWQRGEVSVAGEHFVSAALQRRLAANLDAIPGVEGAPRVMVGLARGSRHELGVLAFAIALARAGAEVVYVGGDLPPDSWVVAATTQRPDAVVIGVPSADDVPAVRDTVSALGAVRPELPVFVGGRHQDDVGAAEPLGHSLRDAATSVVRRLERS